MQLKAIGIIPARFESVRFPGKPLIDIEGQSMLQRVYRRAAESPSLSELYIATDDTRIFEHALSFTDHVLMTPGSCRNGTERIAAACRQLSNELPVVINIQGDEPLLQPEQLDQLVALMQVQDTEIATLAYPLGPDEKDNPNVVKVAFESDGRALGFSRDHHFLMHAADTLYKHIGLYAFKAATLQRIVGLSPTPNEQLERLEQLRWLDHGYSIRVGITPFHNLSVDIPEDVDRIVEALKDYRHK